MSDIDDPLADVFVANVMTEPIETIATDASAATAAERLIESDIGSILAGAESPPPDGILTESDFVGLAAERRDPTATTVAECMSAPVITVRPSDPIGEAARTMADRNVKKLPVVEPETERAVGIVTTTDVARYVPVHEFHPEETD